METYFNIRYEMDKDAIYPFQVDRYIAAITNRKSTTIDRFIREQAPTYICVADGVILNITNRNPEYLKVVNGSACSLINLSMDCHTASLSIS